MASVAKFTAGAVRNQLRHNLREIEHSSNADIDPARRGRDYILSPDRAMSEYDYFLQRKSELYSSADRIKPRRKPSMMTLCLRWSLSGRSRSILTTS